MNISQLECFISVAGHLSFARAAEELNISQPAVTHQIQSLEDELGGKLLLRSTKTVALTNEGKIFLEDAKRILSIAKKAEERFKNPDSCNITPYNIGCIHGIGNDFLLSVLEAIKSGCPDLHPYVFSVSAAEIIMRTADGSLDAAMGFKDESYKKSDLSFKEICKSRLLYFSSLGAAGVSEDIKKNPIIIWDAASILPAVDHLQKEILSEKHPKDVFFCESIRSAVAMSRAGFGFTIVPDIFLSEEASDDCNVIEIEAEAVPFGVYYRSSDDSKSTSDFVRKVKKLKAQNKICKAGDGVFVSPAEKKNPSAESLSHQRIL